MSAVPPSTNFVPVAVRYARLKRALAMGAEVHDAARRAGVNTRIARRWVLSNPPRQRGVPRNAAQRRAFLAGMATERRSDRDRPSGAPRTWSPELRHAARPVIRRLSPASPLSADPLGELWAHLAERVTDMAPTGPFELRRAVFYALADINLGTLGTYLRFFERPHTSAENTRF